MAACIATACLSPVVAQVRFPADAKRLLHEARNLAEMSSDTRQPDHLRDRLTILLAAAHRMDNNNTDALYAMVNISKGAKNLPIYLKRYLALVPRDEVAQSDMLKLKWHEALSNYSQRQMLRETAENIKLPPATRASANAILASLSFDSKAMRLVGRQLEEAYKLNPDDPLLWGTVLKAAYKTRDKRRDGPTAAFVQILLRYPILKKYAWNFADELYNLGLYNQANEMYDYCRAINPTIAGGGDLTEPYLLQIAGARYAAGKYDEAGAICREILKTNPNSLPSYESLLHALHRRYDALAGDPIAQKKIQNAVNAAQTAAIKICESLVPDPTKATNPNVLTQVAAFYLFHHEKPTDKKRQAAAAEPSESQKIAQKEVAMWDKLIARAVVLSERAKSLAPTDDITARIWAWSQILAGKAGDNEQVLRVLDRLYGRSERKDQLAALGIAIIIKEKEKTAKSSRQSDNMTEQARAYLKAAYDLDRGSPIGYKILNALKADGVQPNDLPAPGMAATYAKIFTDSAAAKFYKDKSKALKAVFVMEMAERREYEFGVPLEGLCMLTNRTALPATMPATTSTVQPTKEATKVPNDPLEGFDFLPKANTPLPITFGRDGLLMPKVSLTVEILEKPGHVIRRLTKVNLHRRHSLGPQQSVTQAVRLDVGPLDSILMQMPQATLTLRITPLVGTDGLESDPTKPGPEGFAASQVTIVRKGFQVTPENMKKLLWDLTRGTVERKIAAATLAAALYREATYPLTKRYEGYAPKPVDTQALAKALATVMRDPSWQVRSATLRLAAWLAHEPEVISALKAATRDKIWLVRLCALDVLAVKLGKKAETAVNSAAISDPDPMVKQIAFYHSRRLQGRPMK